MILQMQELFGDFLNSFTGWHSQFSVVSWMHFSISSFLKVVARLLSWATANQGTSGSIIVKSEFSVFGIGILLTWNNWKSVAIFLTGTLTIS